MLGFERLTLALVALTGLVVAIPLSLVAAIGREWDLAIATLFVAPLLSLVTWLSLRVRRRIVARMVAHQDPLVAQLPEYGELRERGIIPEGWTPSGRTRTVPLAWVFAAGILLPWFWGPLFGATLGHLVVGLWVAALLSGTAILVGLFVLGANKYANKQQSSR
jgi:hypothetical protein